MEREKIVSNDIELRELFKIIWDRKIFIVICTFIITIASIVFVLIKKPVYEAKALIEIGSYKMISNTEKDSSNFINHSEENNNNKVVFVDNVNLLREKLNVLFIDMKKNIDNKESSIVSIKIPYKQKNLIEVISHGYSNQLAEEEIRNIFDYVRDEHSKVLGDIKQRRELRINNLIKKIENIKDIGIKTLDEKILLQSNMIISYKKHLELINKNQKSIQQSNPSLAALKLIEKRDIINSIFKLNIQLMDLKNKKHNFLASNIIELEEEKSLYNSLLLPHNYKETQIVGDIITNKHPIKPKKKLLIVISFVISFIISIFIVFFIRYIKTNRKRGLQ